MEYLYDPQTLDRATASQAIGEKRARILQRVDPFMFPGRLVRAKGAAASQISPSSTTVTAAFAGCRQDCKRFVLDANTAGTVRLTTGNLGRCAGPLPEWTEFAFANGLNEPTYYDLLGSAPSWAVWRFQAMTTPSALTTGLAIIDGSTFVAGIGTAYGQSNVYQYDDGSNLLAYISADGMQAIGYLSTRSIVTTPTGGAGSSDLMCLLTNVGSSSADYNLLDGGGAIAVAAGASVSITASPQGAAVATVSLT